MYNILLIYLVYIKKVSDLSKYTICTQTLYIRTWLPDIIYTEKRF